MLKSISSSFGNDKFILATVARVHRDEARIPLRDVRKPQLEAMLPQREEMMPRVFIEAASCGTV
jgi:hypothetical protein